MQRRYTAYGPEFGAQVLVLRQDSYVSGDWAPGVGFTFRLPFGRVIDGRIWFANARTHRMEEVICPGIGACPSPERVSGWTSALTASLGANLALGEYAGFTAVGFGRTWDSRPRGMSEYGGPTWVWDVGLRRYLKPGLGVEVGYRLLRMRWDNELQQHPAGHPHDSSPARRRRSVRALVREVTDCGEPTAEVDRKRIAWAT